MADAPVALPATFKNRAHRRGKRKRSRPLYNEQRGAPKTSVARRATSSTGTTAPGRRRTWRASVKTVTANMNASPLEQAVFSAAAIDALPLHKIWLDDARKMKAAKEKKLLSDPADGADADRKANDYAEHHESEASHHRCREEPALIEQRDDDAPMPVRGLRDETPFRLHRLQANSIHRSLSGARSDGAVPRPFQRDDLSVSLSGSGSHGQASRILNPKTSILIKFDGNPPVRTPIVVTRDAPFHRVYLRVTLELKLTTYRNRLLAYVPDIVGPSSLFNLDCDKTWRRLADDSRVQSLLLGVTNPEPV
ncbi:hypothetical protein FN846DRAFT_903822 [Sphaerosporella brunnea]|uniref:Uncharacterized protein n=1 Tax=Sphaerosporella brunnea TaxID=1250544 RepID=A0A5J5F6B4_9PEZI|nr:hypothetical protein FN846DRAFT_903822 [Sphaerosporella brunnea]